MEQKAHKRKRDADWTIRQLKEATIALVIEKGISNLSIQPIVKRAGVSQGALFHHFPSKEHLIAAAFDDLLKEFARQFHQIGDELRQGTITLDAFVDRIATTMASEMFISSMEISMAIRADKAFLALVSDGIWEWRQSLMDFWTQTFELPGHDKEAVETHWAMATNTLRGFAFTSTFGGEAEARKRFLAGFADLYLSQATIRPWETND